MQDVATNREPALMDGTLGPGALARLVLVLAAGFVLRSLHPSQPIVENYVGRQIPTAMVARNLERDGDFLHPRLETGPFPNYFPVEPPIYQALVVGLRKATRLPLDVSGRLASALAATLCAWGIYALVKRRAGEEAALAAAAAFSMLPITIRYGRAFQPDALMLGACTAGLACWDLAATSSRRRLLTVGGWILLAVGIAAKATAAYLLAVAFLAVLPRRNLKSALLCGSVLLPTIAWYLWANHLVQTSGSRASAENREIWMAAVGLAALAEWDTWQEAGRFLLLRAFTPFGLFGAVCGFLSSVQSQTTRLWWTWAGLAIATMALLASKLHHEYYWLCLAPVASAGLGLVWARLDSWRPGVAFSAAVGFALLALAASDSTWRTPDEWLGIAEAGRELAEATGKDDLIVAPEALLFYADRRGCRLEYTMAAATRAASEWEPQGQLISPIELIDLYRRNGARWAADLNADSSDQLRFDLNESLAHIYKLMPGHYDFVLAKLEPDEPATDGQ